MQQQYQCPNCGVPIAIGARFCGQCGIQLNWQQMPSPVGQQWQTSGISSQPMLTQNTSGQGKLAVIPSEIKEWNWGAFTFGWLWGVCNSVWISLLCFIPFVSLVMVFVLGAKGNEWAWQSKKWDSSEHFRKTQRTWRNWAIAMYVLYFIIILVAVIAESSTPTSISPPPTS
jgi:predicted nucleic acid-binding Zn ribbon protein